MGLIWGMEGGGGGNSDRTSHEVTVESFLWCSAQDPNTHPDGALCPKAGGPYSTVSQSRALEKTSEPRLQAQAALASSENEGEGEQEEEEERGEGRGRERGRGEKKPGWPCKTMWEQTRKEGNVE